MNEGTLRGITLAVAILSLPGAIAHAEPGAGTVAGVVRIDGTPAAEAQVTVTSSADSTYQGSAVTDAGGAFSIPDVPLGVVEVRVTGPDDALLATGRGVLGRAGETVAVELQPTR